jgi:membrane protein YdbS with pleckstrin-like domain
MASPIFRYWWLLPAIILAVLVYLGGLPLWIALAVVIIALLAIIARRLAVLVKK